MAEMARLQEAEQQLRLKVADLESRIHPLNRIQEKPPAPIRRMIAGLLKKIGILY